MCIVSMNLPVPDGFILTSDNFVEYLETHDGDAIEVHIVIVLSHCAL